MAGSTTEVSPTLANELKIVKDANLHLLRMRLRRHRTDGSEQPHHRAKRACVLGKAWFLNHSVEDRPSCLINGCAASLQAGYDRAAEILTSGKYPIVYGLSDSTCEAQRVAVSIVDWINGTFDTTTSVCHGPSAWPFKAWAKSLVRSAKSPNRGDMIMFWGSNPAESHPRHFTKYSLMPKGMFLPNGRKDRTCVIVDVRKTKSAKAADIFIQIKPRKDFEGLWTLRALAKGVDLDPKVVLDETGVELAVWQDLMARMKAAKFGVIFFGMGLTMTRGKHANSEALLALTRDMNAFTRFTAKPNRGHGNVTGADNVVSWRTGYPFGVNHSRGYPRFSPGEYTTADTLARGEADCAMTIACDRWPISRNRPVNTWRVFHTLRSMQRKRRPRRAAAVAFTVATYGITTPGGTVYRMDDVPIPLRPAFPSPHPSDLEVLGQIEARVKKIVGVTA